jgi:hypothetical protein
MALPSVETRLPIDDLLAGSVFYPACAMDGRPVQYLGGYSHSFVYVDCAIPKNVLIEGLNTFKGYRPFSWRYVEKEELCFRPFKPILPDPSERNPRDLDIPPTFIPYALWAIYERLPDYPESHGPERFSLLFSGGEGVAAFQSLYYSNESTPSIVVLIKSDAFTGNWTNFLQPRQIFARSVIQNAAGIPQYIFVEERSSPPWPSYTKLKSMVSSVRNYDGSHQKLQLWAHDYPSNCKAISG